MTLSGCLNRWDGSLSTVPQVGDCFSYFPRKRRETARISWFSRLRLQLGLDRHGMQLYDLSQLFARRTVSAGRSRWLFLSHFLTSIPHFKSTSKFIELGELLVPIV